jgi:FtsH-binding integral membrane protein
MAKGETMTYVIQAIIVLAWIGLFGASVIAFAEGSTGGSFMSIIGGVVGLVISFALVFWAVNNSEDQPCAKYETTLQYNAATKTTMPMRYCAIEGEWVK